MHIFIFPMRRATLVVVIISVVFVLIMASIDAYKNNQELQQFRAQNNQTQTAKTDEVRSLYGDVPLKSCATLSKTINGSMPARAKYVIIKVNDQAIFDEYQAALPMSNQALLAKDLSAVVCIEKDTSTIYERTPYKSMNDPNAPVETYCVHHRTDFDVYVINAATGQTAGYKKFLGSETKDQLPCPPFNDLNTDWNVYSVPVDATTVAGWLTGALLRS